MVEPEEMFLEEKRKKMMAENDSIKIVSGDSGGGDDGKEYTTDGHPNLEFDSVEVQNEAYERELEKHSDNLKKKLEKQIDDQRAEEERERVADIERRIEVSERLRGVTATVLTSIINFNY